VTAATHTATHHRNVRLPAIAGAAMAVVLAAVACGSSASTPARTSVFTTPPPPTIAATATPAVTPSAVPSIYAVPTSSFVPPAADPIHLDDAMAASLQKTVSTLQSGKLYPGLSVAISFPDGALWTGQSGKAVLSSKTSVTPDTLFSFGSISKTFVAALVARLAQRGTLSLDDPLSKYVPTFWKATDITLRELLNHTSGVMDVFDAPGMAAAILASPTRTWTVEQVLARVGKSRYAFAPGKGYKYSNTDYVLLGAVIEKATGQTVASLVRSEFLTPLGLTHTFLQTEETAKGTQAHGYMTPAAKPRDNSAGAMLPFTSEASVVGPAGAYVSTPSDLALWGSALYGGQILDQATLASMVDISQTSPFKPKWVYGLGFEEVAIGGQVAWGHRGHLDGFWSSMEYLPAYGVTIVVVANAEWSDPIAATASLLKDLVPAG
jgi:D-alanyl-D-alanine carboxypeptidase